MKQRIHASTLEGLGLSMSPDAEPPDEKKVYSELPPPPPPYVWPRIRRVLGIVVRLALILILSAGSYLFVNHYVVSAVEVSGTSMWPTLKDGDRFYLNLWAAHDYSPRRGDIIVLRDPEGGYAVKRIIAVPGESIFLKGGTVFVNNEPLGEPYLPPDTRTYPPTNSPGELLLMGTNRVFVLGDNREISADSRLYGPVPQENILGAIKP